MLVMAFTPTLNLLPPESGGGCSIRSASDLTIQPPYLENGKRKEKEEQERKGKESVSFLFRSLVRSTCDSKNGTIATRLDAAARRNCECKVREVRVVSPWP